MKRLMNIVSIFARMSRMVTIVIAEMDFSRIQKIHTIALILRNAREIIRALRLQPFLNL